jgi:hypothetical protein
MDGADESQEQMLALILRLNKFQTIENLFMDIQFMQYFIPESIWT